MKKIVFLLAVSLYCSLQSFAQYDYDATNPKPTLHSRLEQVTKIYAVVPHSMDQYDRYVFNPAINSLRELGFSVITLDMDFHSESNGDISKLYPVRMPSIKDNDPFLILMMQYCISFNPYAPGIKAFYDFYDTANNWQWQNEISPMPKKAEKVKKWFKGKLGY